jgi:Cft2 family RNA processing exonuclease
MGLCWGARRSVARSVNAVLLSHPDLAHVGALPYATATLGLVCPVYATLPVHQMGQVHYTQTQARAQSIALTGCGPLYVCVFVCLYVCVHAAVQLAVTDALLSRTQRQDFGLFNLSDVAAAFAPARWTLLSYGQPSTLPALPGVHATVCTCTRDCMCVCLFKCVCLSFFVCVCVNTPLKSVCDFALIP